MVIGLFHYDLKLSVLASSVQNSHLFGNQDYWFFFEHGLFSGNQECWFSFEPPPQPCSVIFLEKSTKGK